MKHTVKLIARSQGQGCEWTGRKVRTHDDRFGIVMAVDYQPLEKLAWVKTNFHAHNPRYMVYPLTALTLEEFDTLPDNPPDPTAPGALPLTRHMELAWIRKRKEALAAKIARKQAELNRLNERHRELQAHGEPAGTPE